MATQRDHYARLLAQHYTWMFGIPFEEKVQEQKALLHESGINLPGVAIDLGCGSGFQTAALAELGATRVHAIDTSTALLRELKARSNGYPVTAHEADLAVFDHRVGEKADTIVCMGDTLTHLANKSDLATLFEKVAGNLREGGRLVLSWRDLSKAPKGLGRFIPIRNSVDKIMLCFLEDQGETVMVHDLVHSKGDVDWTFQASAYPKLKVSSAWIGSALGRAGLVATYEKSEHGMTILAARLEGSQ